MSKRLWTMALAVPLTAATVLAVAPAASASGGNVDSGGVRTSGGCSGATTWKMKAKSDNGRLEGELEIDSNRVGQTWAVNMKDNGSTVFTGNRLTKAPSGSFTVHQLTANRAGVDHFVGTARNAASGETCTARVNI
ncbi:MAG: hypothetical protein DLM59_14615 [Pseudonocardiales bacterium]|nr:MAG: hypothetical protein DLM59_14615 [Pseudonocardiales bacterium]